MRWTKLKTLIEKEFTDAVRKRVRLFATGYGGSSWGRSWISIDRNELVCFSDDLAYQARGQEMIWEPARVAFDSRTVGLLIETGEFSSTEFKSACWDHLQEGHKQSLESGNAIRVSLAALHRRVGKKTLEKLLAKEEVHPLVRYIVAFRLKAEREHSASGRELIPSSRPDAETPGN